MNLRKPGEIGEGQSGSLLQGGSRTAAFKDGSLGFRTDIL